MKKAIFTSAFALLISTALVNAAPATSTTASAPTSANATTAPTADNHSKSATAKAADKVAEVAHNVADAVKPANKKASHKHHHHSNLNHKKADEATTNLNKTTGVWTMPMPAVSAPKEEVKAPAVA